MGDKVSSRSMKRVWWVVPRLFFFSRFSLFDQTNPTVTAELNTPPEVKAYSRTRATTVVPAEMKAAYLALITSLFVSPAVRSPFRPWPPDSTTAPR